MRLQAAEWFAEGVTPPEVARRLRVSCNSAYVWRRRWRAGGEAALASRGPGRGGVPVSAVQLERLRAALEAGPAVWGWDEDQRWILERVTALIGRLFRVRYTLRGTSYLLHRLSFSPQVPVHRAAEPRRKRDRRVAGRDLGEGTRLAAATGAYVCFEDEAGQNLRPPKARTWAPRGRTPVVRVSGKGSGRVSVAGLVCLKPGARGRLLLPGPHSPRAQGRAPLDVRRRLRRADHRRAPGTARPGHL